MRAAELVDEVAAFESATGAPSRVEEIEIDGSIVPRITNEYWTAQQRQGHSLHEISYRACYKAELPRFFLTRLSREGDRVFDPFLGRGTTAIEAALHGRAVAGCDVNPLSKLLTEPRLAPPEIGAVAERVREILASHEVDPDPGEPDLEPFYEERTLRDLRKLRRWFVERELDDVDRWIRMVATNRLTGHSKGFFSGRTMPPNQAVLPERQRLINDRLGQVPPYRDVAEIVVRKTKSLLRKLTAFDVANLARARRDARIETRDARDLDFLPRESVALTITSPPFLDVVDYATDNWLRCWFNGIDAEAVARRIATLSDLEAWRRFCGEVFAALFSITRPGGYVAFEVGEVRKGTVRLEEHVVPVAAAAGFDPVCVLVHEQRFTKTANCWGVTNNRRGTNTNRIVVLRRPGAQR